MPGGKATAPDISDETRPGPVTRSAARKRKADHITIQYEPEKKSLTTTRSDVSESNDADEEEEKLETPTVRESIDDDKDSIHKFNPKTKKGKKRISEDNRKNFAHIHTQVTKMRKVKDAPVDVYARSRRDIDPNLGAEDVKFQSIVSLLISVQTKGQATHQISKDFREQVGTIDKTLAIDDADLQALLKPAGLAANKTKFIKGCARMVTDEYNGKMPTELDDVLRLPGVGYKIAILYLKHVEGKIEGIGVDSNVHRVMNRLGLVDTKSADQTRLELESFVDQKHWDGFNRLFVGFGQQICMPRHPKCNVCLLNNICPSADVRAASQRDRKKVKNTVDEEPAEIVSRRAAQKKIQIDLSAPEKGKRVKVTQTRKK